MNNYDGLTQCEKILNEMYKYIDSDKIFFAKDFMQGECFIGYEASARMSDLKRMYPQAFIEERKGRFRGLRCNPEEREFIEDLLGIKRGVE